MSTWATGIYSKQVQGEKFHIKDLSKLDFEFDSINPAAPLNVCNLWKVLNMFEPNKGASEEVQNHILALKPSDSLFIASDTFLPTHLVWKFNVVSE